MSAVAAAVGEDVRVPTIDVYTHADGPRGLTLGGFAANWEDGGRRRRRLLNCVSLSLAHTPLAAAVSPPAAVRQMDLVAAAWPPEADAGAPPEVLLYALMSPAGAYTDWHIDFAASAVWYHLLSGSKRFPR